MEISKSLCKVLGTASPVFSPSSNISHASSTESASHLPPCELNRSPWDALYPDHPDSDRQRIQDEEKHDVIITKSDPESEDVKYYNLNLFESAIEIMEDQEKKEKKNKTSKMRMKKRKEKPHIASSATITERVSENNDRRGWKCKGEACSVDSFCHYNLEKFWPYNYVKACKSSDANVQNKNTNKKKVAKKKFDISSKYYYYYAGFGPWREKNRTCGCNSENSAIIKDTDKQVACNSGGDSGDRGNIKQENAVQADHDNKENVNEKEIKRKVRKPIKFRSLKSFL